MARKSDSQNFASGRSPLLGRCKRIARKFLRWAQGIESPTASRPRIYPLDVERAKTNGQKQLIDCHGDAVQFEEFMQKLNIGDRVEIMCDDGVLVAEKISKTRFEIASTQSMSPFLH